MAEREKRRETNRDRGNEIKRNESKRKLERNIHIHCTEKNGLDRKHCTIFNQRHHTEN